MSERIDQLTRAYILLRDVKKLREKEFKEKLETEILSKMRTIEGLLEKHMLESGLESLPTKYGTPYKSVVTTVSVVDWDEARDFIESNNLQHWYVKKLAKEGVQEYIEQYDEVPPGVTINRRTNINVRSKT